MLIRLFVLFWCLACGFAEAAMPPALTVEYSADRKMETDQGTFDGSVVATPVAERSEMRVSGMSTVMIIRKDRKVGYMLMPAQKMYRELDFAMAAKQAGAMTPEQLDLDAVGTETVSGQTTTKYKFVMKDKSAGGFLWYTASGIPVKMDVLSKSGKDKTRMTITLESIQIGTQDPQAFEVPAGFAKMPGGGMFGGMGGGSAFGGEVAGAAVDAGAATATNEATAHVAQGIDNPIARSAGVAAARKAFGKLNGLLRK